MPPVRCHKTTWPASSKRRTNAPISAITRFESGPATATMTSPLRRLRRFAGLTGVGLAQPKRNPPSSTEMIVIIPPTLSKWTIGLSVRRPKSFAVESPRR